MSGNLVTRRQLWDRGQQQRDDIHFFDRCRLFAKGSHHLIPQESSVIRICLGTIPCSETESKWACSIHINCGIAEELIFGSDSFSNNQENLEDIALSNFLEATLVGLALSRNYIGETIILITDGFFSQVCNRHINLLALDREWKELVHKAIEERSGIWWRPAADLCFNLLDSIKLCNSSDFALSLSTNPLARGLVAL